MRVSTSDVSFFQTHTNRSFFLFHSFYVFIHLFLVIQQDTTLKKMQTIGTRLDTAAMLLKQMQELHITEISESNRMKLELSQTLQQQQLLQKEEATASGLTLTPESSKKKASELDEIVTLLERQEITRCSPSPQPRLRSCSGSETSMEVIPPTHSPSSSISGSSSYSRTRGVSVSTGQKESRSRVTVMDLFSNPPPENK